MKLVLKSQPLDYELCELLGSTPVDFVVLCFDGVQLDFFGTPLDSSGARATQQSLAVRLNDRSENSLWPSFWYQWRDYIARQFGLHDTMTCTDYRPVVTCEISRVCAGYSEHLHAAIGLFEMIKDKIVSWGVRRLANGKSEVEIVAKDSTRYSMSGKDTAKTISKCVLALLKDQPKPKPA